MYSVKINASKSPDLKDLQYKGESLVGKNGELNASSKKELLQQQIKFLNAANETSSLFFKPTLEESRELLTAAFNDKEACMILGEKISDALYITANRQGFMRKYLAKMNVLQGSIPRFPVRSKNVTAVWSTSPTRVESQITRDKWLTPPELDIVARPFVTQTEMNQSVGDVLQEKFIEATEATMVAEDRLWYNQVNTLVGVDNPLTIVSSGLTPAMLMSVVTKVQAWGLKTAHVLMATDLWQDIVGNSEFYNAIDPVARHELLMTGELGTIYGMTVTSDAYRHPEHKVLSRGEFFVISEAIHHGAYSDRGGMTSVPTDISIEKIPGRGFVITESIAVAVASSRSVAKGIRL